MLRDALRALEGIAEPAFVIWRGARRCYFNSAARAAFPQALGESGSAFVRATPFVQELVRTAEREPDPHRAARRTFGEVEFVSVPLFDFEGGIVGTIVRAGRLEDVPEMYREFQADASLLSQIVHLLPVLVFTVRPTGEHDFVNRPFLEYCGLAVQRAGHLDFDAAVHPEDRGSLPAPWHAAAEAADGVFTAEVRLLAASGAYRWHALRLTAIRSRGGNIVKWIGTLLDIDDRLAARERVALVNAQLDARVDELERVLDVAPVGIAIANGFESDEVRLNRALMDLLGESEPFVPYGHAAFRYLRGVDLEQIDPVSDGVEIDIERTDGSLRRVSASVVPLKGLDGNGGVVAAYVDISAQRAEAWRRETLLAVHRGLVLAATAEEGFAAIVAAVRAFADACAIATAETVVVRDDGIEPALASALERGIAASGRDGRAMVVPCTVDGRVVATLALRRTAPQPPFDGRDFEAFVELGHTVAIAFDRMTILARERSVGHRLNRLLLPTRLPKRAGLDVSVAYRTADGMLPVGGDWYDAFALPDDRIAISIGDVAGHGIEAAIAMYAVRQAIRDAAFAGRSPAGVLADANELAFEHSPERFATACFAVIDSQRQTIRYALAGHPPPIVATAYETRVARAGGVPLGVLRGGLAHEDTIDLAGVRLFALYTDGVTEYARDAIAGEDRLRRALEARHACGRDGIARAIFDDLFAAGTLGDDAALLVVQFDALQSEPAPEGDGTGRQGAERTLLGD